MQQQPSPSSCAGGDDFDFVFPPGLFLFPELDGDGGFADEQASCMEEQQQQQQAMEAETQVREEKLVMGYDGRRFEFDSVQPHKVETILSLLHGQEPAAPAESAKPYLTYLVPPIVVPPDFDRPAALMRYRAKKRRKRLRAVVKADYSCRREVARRMERTRGKFASSAKKSPGSESLTLSLLMNMQVRQLREAQRRDAQDAAWPGRVQNALQRLRPDVGQNRETTGGGEPALRRRMVRPQLRACNVRTT